VAFAAIFPVGTTTADADARSLANYADADADARSLAIYGHNCTHAGGIVEEEEKDETTKA